MPHRLKRLSLPLTALVLSSPLALAGEPLKIFGLRLDDPDALLFTSFTETTGIPVELVSMPMDELAAAMAGGDTPPVDVLMVVDSGNIQGQVEAGWFQPVQSEWLEERVPEGLRHLEAGWSGYATRARVIVINADKLDWIPDSYEGLADERLAGQLCLGNGASAYNASLVSSMVAYHGEAEASAWVAGLMANLAQPTGGRDGELLRALAEPGECAVTVANHYYLLRMLESRDGDERAIAESLTLVWPNQQGEGLAGRGAYQNVAGFAVARGTPNTEAAVQFLEHTASDTIQRAVAEGIFYPVVASDDIGAVARLGEAKMSDLPMSELGSHVETTRRVMGEQGWE